MNKKRIGILIILFAVVVLGTSSFISKSALAQTNEQIIQNLKAQVEQLQAQIKILQQQLGGGTNSSGPKSASPTPVPPQEGCPTFSSTLSKGMSDERTNGEVSKLQKMLATDSEVYPEKLVTGYYGSLTEKAVQRWQAKNGVVSSGTAQTTGYGVVGVQTSAKMSITCSMPIPRESVSISVLSPNGGETWTQGTKQIIKWQDNTPFPTCPTGYGCVQGQPSPTYDITINNYSDTKCVTSSSGAVICPTYRYAPYATIAKNITITYYDWTVGAVKDLYDALLPEGSYTIKVCQSGTNICDSSDSYFKIASMVKGVTQSN